MNSHAVSSYLLSCPLDYSLLTLILLSILIPLSSLTQLHQSIKHGLLFCRYCWWLDYSHQSCHCSGRNHHPTNHICSHRHLHWCVCVHWSQHLPHCQESKTSRFKIILPPCPWGSHSSCMISPDWTSLDFFLQLTTDHYISLCIQWHWFKDLLICRTRYILSKLFICL